MTRILNLDKDYIALFKNVKDRILASQIKASFSVNTELLKLYWDLAKIIIKEQESSNWGDNVLSKLSSDLKLEFPDMKGFSPTNLKYMRNWYLFYQ